MSKSNKAKKAINIKAVKSVIAPKAKKANKQAEINKNESGQFEISLPALIDVTPQSEIVNLPAVIEQAETKQKPVKLSGATFYGITITNSPASSVFSKQPNKITGQPKTQFKTFSSRSNLMLDALKQRYNNQPFDGKYCDLSIADNAVFAGYLKLLDNNQLQFTDMGLKTRYAHESIVTID